jgi:hypothetical protein
MGWQRKRFERETGDEGLLDQLSQPELLAGIIAERWRGKFYENKERELPDGTYVELNSSRGGGDMRRALLDVASGDLFLTDDHYAVGSFRSLGNVGYSPRQVLQGTPFSFL